MGSYLNPGSASFRRKDGWLMGIYLNPGNNKFKRAVNSDIYVDKTGLIEKRIKY